MVNSGQNKNSIITYSCPKNFLHVETLNINLLLKYEINVPPLKAFSTKTCFRILMEISCLFQRIELKLLFFNFWISLQTFWIFRDLGKGTNQWRDRNLYDLNTIICKLTCVNLTFSVFDVYYNPSINKHLFPPVYYKLKYSSQECIFIGTLNFIQ